MGKIFTKLTGTGVKKLAVQQVPFSESSNGQIYLKNPEISATKGQ